MYFYIRGLFFILFLICGALQAQTIQVQGVSNVSCPGSYCLTIQVKGADPGSFELGTSSVFVEYDSAALQFMSYTPSHFDGSDQCNAGSAAWEFPTFDGSKPGMFSLTLILKQGQENNSCPSVTDGAWVDVGEVCFNILDIQVHPNIVFNSEMTNFNKNIPNDGTAVLEKGTTEIYHATCGADDDIDGIVNNADNCLTNINPLQEDSDADGMGDACDSICNFVINTTPDIKICEGSAVTLTALSQNGVPPYTYLWDNGLNASSILVAPATTEKYYVTITDATQCIGVDSIEVDISVGDLVHLELYDLDSLTTFDIIEDGADYYISTLPVNFNMRAIVSGDVESVGFTVEGAQFETREDSWPPYGYPGSWSSMTPDTGLYTVTARIYSENELLGVSCDEEILSFEIHNDCADLGIPEEHVVCLGDSITLYADVSGAHGVHQVSWSNGMVGDSIVIAPTNSIWLEMTVTDESNCTTYGGTYVTVTNADLLHLVIYNLDDSLFHDTILHGDIIQASSLPANWNIEALVTAPESGTQSVGFDVYDDLVEDRTENSPPYRFDGDNNPLNLGEGNYTFVVSAWSGNWRNGYSCGTYTFSFQIANYDSCTYVFSTDEHGTGTLKNALSCALPGETIYFSQAVHHDTIFLDESPLQVNSNINISALSVHNIVVSARNVPSAFEVSGGVMSEIDGLHIIAGTAASGSAVTNSGSLTLDNIRLCERTAGPPDVDIVKNTGNLTFKGTTRIERN